jgi:hypothetical protein
MTPITVETTFPAIWTPVFRARARVTDMWVSLYHLKNLLLMVVDFEDNKVSTSIKYSERAVLFVDAEIPDAAAIWLSFFEFYLKRIAG